jgi:peptidoglycan hydrolase-like protein with peptidoglycan-binding domain
MAAVRQWQSQNGLTVDGKLGNNSLRKLQELKAAAEQQAANQQVTNQQAANQEVVNKQTPTNTPSTETVVTPKQSQMVDPAFKYQRPNERFFRYHYGGTEDIKMGNDTYPVFVTRSESIGKNNKWGLKGDESYAYDPATGRVRRL